MQVGPPLADPACLQRIARAVAGDRYIRLHRSTGDAACRDGCQWQHHGDIRLHALWNLCASRHFYARADTEYANNNPIDNIDPKGRETGAGYGNGEYGVYSHTPSPEEIRFSDQVDDGLDHLLQPLVAEVPEFEGVGTLLSEVREASTVEVTVAATDLSDVPHSSITAPYTRPNNATTVAQRAAQQGKPCVSCGKTADKMVADHKTPLVQEYYTTGTVDMKKATSNQAVQPQCPTCSAQQGGKLSQYGKQMKKVVQQRSQQQSTGT